MKDSLQNKHDSSSFFIVRRCRSILVSNPILYKLRSHDKSIGTEANLVTKIFCVQNKSKLNRYIIVMTMDILRERAAHSSLRLALSRA